MTADDIAIVCYKKHNQLIVLFYCSVLLFGAVFPSMSFAQQGGGFAGGVSPSRFEVSASAADIVRRSIGFYNLGSRPTDYNISTVEWNYSADGEISFTKELKHNSCRPWVKLERHKISIVPNPNQARNFRFEMHVPEDQADVECRFAIMVESMGKPHQTTVGSGAINLPVTGRIAVIVYLQVGKVAPKIELVDVSVKPYQGALLPMVNVRNSGSAHGRLSSDLSGTTALGQKIVLHVATSPIMANQTRELPLHIDGEIDGDIYPLKLKGKVYADNQTFSIDTTLVKP